MPNGIYFIYLFILIATIIFIDLMMKKQMDLNLYKTMKNFCLIFVIAVLASCNQHPPKIATDNRPATEQGLIAQLNNADSTYNDQNNPISKKEVLDSMKSKVPNYILKQLDAKIENWQATVSKIDINLMDAIEVKLSVPLHFDGDEKDAEYNAIILTATVGFDQQGLKEVLKTLKPKDKVEISGLFHKTDSGEIIFIPANVTPDDEAYFTNPEFYFEIKSIKKIAQ